MDTTTTNALKIVSSADDNESTADQNIRFQLADDGCDELLRARKNLFLANFSLVGTIKGAAEAAGLHRCTHYAWLEADKHYVAEFADVRLQYIEKLEAEADRRAIEGVEEPVFHNGGICGHKRRYSDTLLIFRLKALAPEKYRERAAIAHKHEHPVSGSPNNRVGLSDAELQAEITRAASQCING